MNRDKPMFLLQIKPFDLQKFAKSCAYLQRPQLIGFYSYNYENCTPAKYIKYFKEPKSSDYPLDLNEGYVTCRFRVPRTDDSRLHLPLNYAMSGEGKAKEVGRTTVYTGRRVLSKLMEWCYAKYDFNIWVSRYNGNLYMVGELSPYLTKVENIHHQRLEQLLFADSPNGKPNLNEPIDENIALSVLHQSELGDKYYLIYAGEAQGIIANEQVKNFDDMDVLNKCRFVFTKQMWRTMKKEYKFLTFWIQSYLSSIDDIYLAYKNYNGIVEQPIEHIKVSDMPKQCSWKPAVCVGFLNHFIETIEALMSNVNSLDTVYEFQFMAQDKSTHYTIYEGRSDKSFIPKIYADFITK